ncbi:MAG: 1-(5-phosphoribosyl)-5-((5-phosphoribosylamino)methylideneamino)imidazole-4-carboxamide isomerase [Actinobacteria bacterium]|nr:1-(5-phosphoribosyl)-5-((5-phosphoribosylamino)methylideneamino)imidazole-4-carboxamide isomerase [Actinomycetota bacterium]
MELYPAIDIRGGRAVRLHQGDFDRETIYDDDPIARARAFETAGARWVHVVDLDAARTHGTNRDVVVALSKALSIPVQTGGGVRDASLLADGVGRIVCGSIAVSNPGFTQSLISSYPGRVAVGLDHRDGEIRTRGWEVRSGVQLHDAVQWPAFSHAASFVITNIARDATMAGPDIEGLGDAVASTAVPVVASGGVGSLDDLRALRDVGVAGVIVGKAIYEQCFTVEEALAACEA